LVVEKNHQESVIKIPQIKIVSNKSESESAAAILSQLKIAVDMSRENLEQSEAERAEEILKMLKKQTHLTPSTEAKVMEALATIETAIVSNEKTISKSTEQQKVKSANLPKTIMPKKSNLIPISSAKSADTQHSTIGKQGSKTNKTTLTSSHSNTISHKKTTPKKSVNQKNIVHSKAIQSTKKRSPTKTIKKFIVKRVEINRTIVKQVTRPIHHEPKKSLKKHITKKKPHTIKLIKKTTTLSPIVKEKFSIIKKEIPKKYHSSKLSREEEVAQYEKASANGLEVLAESNLFEINTPKNSRQDATYFEPLQHNFEQENNAPLEFVKTLGVVEVSKKYEVGNLEIPQMIELAKEGVVDISSATIETEALRKLKFVDPLEVLDVSPVFETIDAQKYIK
jgi:hypothetical protein